MLNLNDGGSSFFYDIKMLAGTQEPRSKDPMRPLHSR